MLHEFVDEVIAQQARRFPGKSALVVDGHPITYQELQQQVDHVARALVTIGVRPGDRVGLFAEFSPAIDAQLSRLGMLYESLVSTLHQAGLSGNALNDTQLLVLRRDRAYLARQCIQVMSLLVEHASASSFTADSVVQRQWRDVQVMASHRDVAWGPAMTAYGDELLRCTEVASHKLEVDSAAL